MNAACIVNPARPPANCDEYAFLTKCGGWDEEERRAVGCFGSCPACRTGPCDCACPINTVIFDASFEQVGGICTPPNRFVGPSMVPTEWPGYIPLIYHGSNRRIPLSEPWVSISLHHVTRMTTKGRIDLAYEDRADLCKGLALDPKTKIVLSCVCQDRYIEAFWASRRSRRLLERIASWGLVGMTTPNYSFMLDTPRTNSLWNLTRIFRMVEWITDAGIPAVPHINASTRADWKKWVDICRSFPESRFYSMEFQTGLCKGIDADARRNRYLANLQDLQFACGGRIHPVVLGGIRSAERLSSFCPSFTIVDPTPFMKTMKRQKPFSWGTGRSWHLVSTGSSQCLSQRLHDNIAAQRSWFYGRFGMASDGKLLNPPLYPAA